MSGIKFLKWFKEYFILIIALCLITNTVNALNLSDLPACVNADVNTSETCSNDGSPLTAETHCFNSSDNKIYSSASGSCTAFTPTGKGYYVFECGEESCAPADEYTDDTIVYQTANGSTFSKVTPSECAAENYSVIGLKSGDQTKLAMCLNATPAQNVEISASTQSNDYLVDYYDGNIFGLTGATEFAVVTITKNSVILKETFSGAQIVKLENGKITGSLSDYSTDPTTIFMLECDKGICSKISGYAKDQSTWYGIANSGGATEVSSANISTCEDHIGEVVKNSEDTSSFYLCLDSNLSTSVRNLGHYALGTVAGTSKFTSKGLVEITNSYVKLDSTVTGTDEDIFIVKVNDQYLAYKLGDTGTTFTSDTYEALVVGKLYDGTVNVYSIDDLSADLDNTNIIFKCGGDGQCLERNGFAKANNKIFKCESNGCGSATAETASGAECDAANGADVGKVVIDTHLKFCTAEGSSAINIGTDYYIYGSNKYSCDNESAGAIIIVESTAKGAYLLDSTNKIDEESNPTQLVRCASADNCSEPVPEDSDAIAGNHLSAEGGKIISCDGSTECALISSPEGYYLSFENDLILCDEYNVCSLVNSPTGYFIDAATSANVIFCDANNYNKCNSMVGSALNGHGYIDGSDPEKVITSDGTCSSAKKTGGEGPVYFIDASNPQNLITCPVTGTCTSAPATNNVHLYQDGKTSANTIQCSDILGGCISAPGLNICTDTTDSAVCKYGSNQDVTADHYCITENGNIYKSGADSCAPGSSSATYILEADGSLFKDKDAEETFIIYTCENLRCSQVISSHFYDDDILYICDEDGQCTMPANSVAGYYLSGVSKIVPKTTDLTHNKLIYCEDTDVANCENVENVTKGYYLSSHEVAEKSVVSCDGTKCDLMSDTDNAACTDRIGKIKVTGGDVYLCIESSENAANQKQISIGATPSDNSLRIESGAFPGILSTDVVVTVTANGSAILKSSGAEPPKCTVTNGKNCSSKTYYLVDRDSQEIVNSNGILYYCEKEDEPCLENENVGFFINNDNKVFKCKSMDDIITCGEEAIAESTCVAENIGKIVLISEKLNLCITLNTPLEIKSANVGDYAVDYNNGNIFGNTEDHYAIVELKEKSIVLKKQYTSGIKYAYANIKNNYKILEKSKNGSCPVTDDANKIVIKNKMLELMNCENGICENNSSQETDS